LHSKIKFSTASTEESRITSLENIMKAPKNVEATFLAAAVLLNISALQRLKSP
jgi:hypothetical protein